MSACQNRAEYDSWRDSFPEDARWQFWPVPWRFATWHERFVKLFLWMGGAIFVAVGFIAMMALFATIVDNAAQRNVDHDRCMKHATNGYEIERCR